MNATTRSLEELRTEIDAIDRELHALISRRGGLAGEIAEIKKRDGLDKVRPGREAMLLRALVERHDSAFPVGSVLRIWRELISSLVAMEMPEYSVAVYATGDDQGCWDLARDQFGSHTQMIAHPSGRDAIAQVFDGAASLAVVPCPTEDAPGAWWQGDEGDGSLKIFREAELMHGRIAQLACLGWVFPELAHFPGKDGAFGKMNPFEAVDAIPNAGWYQILAFMASLEVYRVNKLKDPSYVPGDLSLGQGPGRWNPFGFDYTPEEYAEKQLQEIKHCRLAMLGIIGLAAKSSGAGDVGVLAMLGGGKPEFVTKAGFYFPEGI